MNETYGSKADQALELLREIDPDDCEHVIKCHSDQLPEYYRYAMKKVRAAIDLLYKDPDIG